MSFCKTFWSSVEPRLQIKRQKKKFYDKLVGLKFNVEDCRATVLDAQNVISQNECQ
jgi:hypothetical protein